MRTRRKQPDRLQPRFIVGRDHEGCWIVHDRLDRVGGLFTSEDAARRFASEEADHDAMQIGSANHAIEPSVSSNGEAFTRNRRRYSMFTHGRSAIAQLTSPRAMGRTIPVEYFTLANLSFHGEIVGTLGGRPIHDIAVDDSGQRYRFAGVAPRTVGGRYDVSALSEGEWIVEPGLLYRLEETMCAT